MTIKEKYGLEFHSKSLHESNHYNILIKKGYEHNSFLQLISRFHLIELEAIIYDINKSLDTKNNWDNGFISGSTTNDIVYAYPNIKFIDWASIDKTVSVISMVDLKELIEEWLNFIKSEELKRKREKSIITQLRKKFQIFIMSILNKNESLS